MASFQWPPNQGSGGTVTSVGFTEGSTTPIFTISGSPVTGSGTITETLKTQTANTILAGPTTGAAAQPAFRAVVAADLPTGNLTDAGTDGITVTGGTGAVIGSGTSLSQHVADTTHNGYLSSSDWNTFSGKQPAGNYITALTGDVAATGPGSVAATLATVNASPGTTTISTVTTNAKGLVTANSSATTTGSGSVVLATAPTMSNPVVGTQATSDNSTKAASTAYVTTAIANAVAGVNPAVAVQAATTAAADTSTFTYNNGVSGIGATLTSNSTNTALTVDGFTFTTPGQRLLVKNDTQSPSGAFNGIYSVTQIQTLTLPVILTRALDYDTPSDINNTGAIPVINGTTNGTTSWVETALVNTVGTDPLSFTKFTRNPADYLLKANNLSDVASASTSFNNISPMTTGGDIIYGGASGAGNRLPNGSSGQVLTSSGGTSAPSWQTPSSSGTNVSGLAGAAGAIEEIEQKAENEHYGIQTEVLDNSVNTGFNIAPASYGVIGYLMDTFTSGGTTTPSIVWSPQFLNSSDQDTTTTTNWAAENNGATLAQSATNKVGGHSISISKTSGGSTAGFKYDAGSAKLQASGSTRLYFWMFLPTLSAGTYTNIYVVIDVDGTNYSTWLLTQTQSAGSLTANSWNLMFVDLLNTAPSSSAGTGWNSTLSFRFAHFGVTTSSSTATASGILLNGIYFSLAGLNVTNPSPVNFLQLGSEVTLFDGTNRDSMVIASSNTQVDGPLTIAASLGHTYSTPGVSSSNAANIARSSMILGANQATFASNYFLNSSNALAGNITTTQEARIAIATRDALSSNTLGAYCCVNTPQAYTVSSTTTNVIIVNDASNTSANLKSGDILWVFRTIYVDGQANTVNRGSFTLTSNSTASGGLTTLTGTGGVPVGTVVGDYVVKDHLTFSTSAVSIGANESFSALTNNSTPANPDGIILYNTGLPIPNPMNVQAYYTLGGNTGVVNQKGPFPTLTTVGSLVTTASGLRGQQATTGWSSAADYYKAVGTAGSGIDSPGIFSVSVWYYLGASGNTLSIISTQNSGGNANWSLGLNSSNQPTMTLTGSVSITSSTAVAVGTWNHIVWNYAGGAGNTIYLNGAMVGSSTTAIGTEVNQDLQVGYDFFHGMNTSDKLFQVVFWTGSNLSASQVLQMYNSGQSQILGFGPMLKYRYQINSVTGQTVSLKGSLARTTTAVTPYISKMGAIKIG